jgi:hypothetical protein
MLGLKVIVGAALLAQGVFGEGVHLFNCGPFGAAGAPKTWYSIVAVRELSQRSSPSKLMIAMWPVLCQRRQLQLPRLQHSLQRCLHRVGLEHCWELSPLGGQPAELHIFLRRDFQLEHSGECSVSGRLHLGWVRLSRKVWSQLTQLTLRFL